MGVSPMRPTGVSPVVWTVVYGAETALRRMGKSLKADLAKGGMPVPRQRRLPYTF